MLPRTRCWMPVVWAILLANTVAAEPVTWEQALHHALDHHPSLQQARQDIAIAEAQVLKTYGMFDFKLDGSLRYSDSRTEATTPFAPERSEVFSYAVSLSEKTMIGGFASLSYQSARTQVWYPVFDAGYPLDLSLLQADLAPAYQPELSLSYTQPLLKDFWGRPDLTALRIADRSIDLARQALRQSIWEQADQLHGAYLQVQFAAEALAIQRQALKNASDYYAQAQRLRKIGLREDKDLLQTRASWLSAQARITPAENTLAAAREAFYNLAGYPPEAWDTLVLEPGRGPEEVPAAPEPLAAAGEERLVALQPEIRLLDLQAEMTQLNLQVLQNAALPYLALFGSVGLSAYAGDNAEAHAELGAGTYPAWSAGLNVSLSFPDRTSRGDLDAKQAELGKLSEQRVAAARGLRLRLRDAHRRLLAAREEYRLQREIRGLTAQTLAIQAEHFSQGRISTRELLLAQGDDTSAQFQEAQAWLAYAQAAAAWQRLTGGYDRLAAPGKE